MAQNMNIFNKVLMKRPKRSAFDLSHDNKLSLDMGRLTPILVQEVLPSDKFTLRSEHLIRFAPLISPVMHKIDVFTHYFFVPSRIVWDGWEDFITGASEIQPVLPYYVCKEPLESGKFLDYMGVPNFFYSEVAPLKINALPIFSFLKIYNEYYRDQNLQPDAYVDAIDGDNTAVLDELYSNIVGNPIAKLIDSEPPLRAWQHDYFTSALPFPQKGPDVMLPLGDSAPIFYEPKEFDPLNPSLTGTYFKESYTGNMALDSDNITSVADATETILSTNPGSLSKPRDIDNSQVLFADLSEATQTTINELRKAFRLQEWLEKNARGGTRYVESLLSHFAVRSSDARLQRPEYLGGGKSQVMISEVLQTSSPQGETDTPQGNLSGHGVNVGVSHDFTRTFEEHGFIIGIMSVMPTTAYSQGLPRLYKKFDFLDYAFPSFAHLGEQEVFNYEIRCLPDNATNEGQNWNTGTFGYLPRYQEYRFRNSEIHGDFRETLHYWHLGRKFGDGVYPKLNAEFISAFVPKDIFAVQDLPDDGGDPTGIKSWNTIYAHIYFKINAVRPLPRFGIPMGV